MLASSKNLVFAKIGSKIWQMTYPEVPKRIRKAIKRNFKAEDFAVQVKVQTLSANKPYEVEGKTLHNTRIITI